MIFDEMGYPRDTGATDFQDSARLAGMMALVNDPRTPQLFRYVREGWTGLVYLRHPLEKNIYKYSRDQLMCFVAGLHAMKLKAWVDPNYRPENGDILTPSQRDHLLRCYGKKPTILGRIWFHFDIIWSALGDPLAESNQLISMMLVAGPYWVRLWTSLNDEWEKSITDYWCNWRNEPELAEALIKEIKSKW